MISPHTAPGTAIVFTDNVLRSEFLSSYGKRRLRDRIDTKTFVPRLNDICHVRCISPDRYAACGFVCLLQEIWEEGVTFPLEAFRYLHLPRSLTDLLETAPTRAPSELEPTQ